MAADKHIRRSGDDYGEALLKQLPQGQAWPRDQESDLYIAVNGLAQIYGTFDGNVADFLEIESDPSKADQMLSDWERNFGLPDPLMPLPSATDAERQATLVQRMTMIGEQDRQFFIDLAAAFGMTIKIREYAPYVCGISRVGDSRMASLTDDTDNYRWQLGRPENRFYWTVKLLSMVGVDIPIFDVPFSSYTTSRAGQTERIVIPPSMLGVGLPSGDFAVTFATSGTSSGSLLQAFIGQSAAAGDEYDFDGNQVQLFFGGNPSPTIAGAGPYVSDPVHIASYDPSKKLVVSASFSGTSVQLAASPDNACKSYVKAGNDAITTNATGYSLDFSKSIGVTHIEIPDDRPQGELIDLLAVLRRWKPAHTDIVFDFGNFNNGNFAFPWYSGNIALF